MASDKQSGSGTRAPHDSGVDMLGRDILVGHLLSRNFIQDEQVLRNCCEEVGFVPQTNRYAVVVVHIERWSSIFASEQEWLEETKHHFLILYNTLHELLEEKNLSFESEQDYQMVCIVNVLQPDDAFFQTLSEVLERAVELLENEFLISVTIGVSGIHEGLTSLPHCYAQARDIFSYNDFFETERHLTFFWELCGPALERQAVNYLSLQKKLNDQLRTADFEGVKYSLHEMIDRELISSRPSISIYRARVGSIICRILDILEELRHVFGEEFYMRLDPAPRLTKAVTCGELTAAMDDLFDLIIARATHRAAPAMPAWVEKIERYVREHYKNPDLTLSLVADQFGVTPSYATRVFKQYRGVGIYEYIQQVRLEAAKTLLHSGITMKQIAEAAGYTSYLSMNRAFKKSEGAAPQSVRAESRPPEL